MEDFKEFNMEEDMITEINYKNKTANLIRDVKMINVKENNYLLYSTNNAIYI